VDNQAISAPLALFRANGVTKVTIDSAGDTQAQGVTATSLTVNGNTILASDAGAGFRNTAGTEGQRVYTARQTTTNSATPTEMSINDGGTVFLPALADGDTYSYIVSVSARGTAGTNDNLSAFYVLKFVVERTGVVANTRIVQSALETVAEEVAAWDLTVQADTTNGRPQVMVTGDAASTVKWVASVQTTKVS
jgi:hypothetical protein